MGRCRDGRRAPSGRVGHQRADAMRTRHTGRRRHGNGQRLRISRPEGGQAARRISAAGHRRPGDDTGCARCVPAIPPGVRDGQLRRTADHTVRSCSSFGQVGPAGQTKSSGRRRRDMHAALSQIPVSPIIHIMSSNRDSALPTGAGWTLIGSRCVPACARTAGTPTRPDDGPRADPGLPRARLRGRDVNLRAAAHPPWFGTTHRRPRRRTATYANGPISRIRVDGVANTPALCDDTGENAPAHNHDTAYAMRAAH